MKRRGGPKAVGEARAWAKKDVAVEVSDHAVLRWLEREHGLDVGAIKAMIAGVVKDGAELEAASVVLGRVRFVLKDGPSPEGVPPGIVVVVTTVRRDGWVRPRRDARDEHDG